MGLETLDHIMFVCIVVTIHTILCLYVFDHIMFVFINAITINNETLDYIHILYIYTQ